MYTLLWDDEYVSVFYINYIFIKVTFYFTIKLTYMCTSYINCTFYEKHPSIVYYCMYPLHVYTIFMYIFTISYDIEYDIEYIVYYNVHISVRI